MPPDIGLKLDGFSSLRKKLRRLPEHELPVPTLDEYLKAADPVNCPAQLYALWLRVWIHQGGPVCRSYNRPLNRFECLLATNSSALPLPIPTALTSPAMRILAVDAYSSDAPIPRYKSDGSNLTVYRLHKRDGKMTAWTNRPLEVPTYTDVQRIVNELSTSFDSLRNLEFDSWLLAAEAGIKEPRYRTDAAKAKSPERQAIDEINLINKELPEDVRFMLVSKPAAAQVETPTRWHAPAMMAILMTPFVIAILDAIF